MTFNIITVAEVFDDVLHNELIKRYSNESMGGLTSDTPRDEDLGYATFNIDFTSLNGDVPKRLDEICEEISKTHFQGFKKMIVSFETL